LCWWNGGHVEHNEAIRAPSLGCAAVTHRKPWLRFGERVGPRSTGARTPVPIKLSRAARGRPSCSPLKTAAERAGDRDQNASPDEAGNQIADPSSQVDTEEAQ
jgi:hypothetical protein